MYITKKHIDEVNGFIEAYNKVYESIYKLKDSNGGFTLMKSQDVVFAFEKKFNVKLLKTERGNSPIGEMVFDFDTIDFITEENLTMCLLKWS